MKVFTRIVLIFVMVVVLPLIGILFFRLIDLPFFAEPLERVFDVISTIPVEKTIAFGVSLLVAGVLAFLFHSYKYLS